MKGHRTPIRVLLLVVGSSNAHLGAPDVDQKGGGSGFAAKRMAKWLDSAGHLRIRVRSEAEQASEHLLSKDMLNEQCDFLRLSTELCFSMRRKARWWRWIRVLQHQPGGVLVDAKGAPRTFR